MHRAGAALDAKAFRSNRVEMTATRNEGDLVSGQCELGAEKSPDAARSHHDDAHEALEKRCVRSRLIRIAVRLVRAFLVDADVARLLIGELGQHRVELGELQAGDLLV